MHPVKNRKLREGTTLRDGSGQLSLIGLSSPLPYLPPEVKQLILSHVTDPTTLEKCCFASSTLSSLLDRRKPTFLFSSILPLIYGSGKNRLHHQSLLNLRLVCKTWRNAIDSFIQNHPTKKAYSSDFHLSQLALYPTITERSNYYLDPYSVSRYAFQVSLSPEDRSLTTFCQEYNLVATVPQFNPFVGRAVILTLNMDGDFFDLGQIIRYIRLLILFVRQFGRQIYYLTLKIPQNSILAYCIFRDFNVSFLQFLPNLRSLTIYTVQLSNILRDNLLNRLGPTRFRNVPEQCPMENLETISIHHIKPEVIASLLLEPFIVKLSRVSLPYWEEGLNNNLPNLKELTLTWLTCNRDLERIGEVNAENLAKLRLQFQWKRVSVKVLRGLLLKFRGSLKCLELDWCGNEVEAKGKALLLRGGVPKGNEDQLEGVHTLTVSHALGVDYGFLRWFPGLVHLYLGETLVGPRQEGVGAMEGPRGAIKKIWERMVEKEGKKGGVEVHKYLLDHKNMHKSNIWKVCDKLTIIKFKRLWSWVVDAQERTNAQEGIEIVWKKKIINKGM